VALRNTAGRYERLRLSDWASVKAQGREISVSVDTVQGGIDMLSTLSATQVIVKGKPGCNRIPKPARPLQRLLEAARVTLPEALPNKGSKCSRKKEAGSAPQKALKHKELRNLPTAGRGWNIR